MVCMTTASGISGAWSATATARGSTTRELRAVALKTAAHAEATGSRAARTTSTVRAVMSTRKAT